MRVMQRIRQNSLVHALTHLEGNARACVLTEPLWGIPANLYAPFVSLYMSALGLSDPMIGLVGTVFLVSQVFFSLLGGVLADKMGRRKCTFYMDLFAWSIPVLLWAFARDQWWFLVAAVFNGMFRITANSWTLLLVEDEEEHMLVKLFALVSIAGALSAAAVLPAFPLVKHFGLVPSVRGMYIFACVSMTAKFVILLFMSRETSLGHRRMAETKDISLGRMMLNNLKLLKNLLGTKQILLTIGLMACFNGAKSLTDTFWPLFVTEKTAILEENLALYAAARSGVMIICYFLLVPRVSLMRFKHPAILCFGALILAKVVLVIMPENTLWLLWLNIVLEALALSLLSPLTESLQMVCLDSEGRAALLSLFQAVVLLLTAPLSYLGGLLSAVNRALPMLLAVLFCALAMWLTYRIWQERRATKGTAQGAV